MRRTVLSVLAGLCALVGAACSAGPAIRLGERLLFGCEDAKAVARIQVRELTTLSPSSTWASEGLASIRVTYEAWSEGKERWPAIVLSRKAGAFPVADFSAYRRLAVDVFNPGTRITSLKLHLRDGKGKRFSKVLTIEPGVSTCSVTIDEMNIDTTDIADLHFYCSQPAEGFIVYLDNLRLSAGLKEDLADLRRDLVRLNTELGDGRDKLDGAMPAALVDRLAELPKLGVAVEQLERGLAAAPPSIPDEMQRTVEAARKEVDRLQVKVIRIAAVAPLLGAAVRARKTGAEGFVLAVESSMVKVPLEAGLFSSAFGREVQLEAARNENEHAQVVVVPFAGDLTNVRWRAEDAFGPGGSIVPLQVRLVGYVDCKQPSYPVSRTGWWPDPLIESQERVKRVPMGEVMPLWVSVSVPKSAEPGEYRGRVVVQADGLPEQQIGVTIDVWDFELPEHTSLRTALSWRNLSTKLYPKERIPELKAAYENWLQREYHLNVGNIYGGPPGWSVERLRELRSMGLNAINLAYFTAPREPDFDADAYWKRFDVLVAWIKAYMPTIEAAGVRDLCYIYCFDERPKEQLDVVFETARKLKRIWPDIEVMTTAYDTTFGLDRPDGAAMDIWVPLTPKFDSHSERLNEARAKGRDIWWYICIGPRNPHANWFLEYTAIEPRLIMGAMTAKYQPGGFLYYAVNRWPLNDRVITQGSKTSWNPASYKNNNGDGSIMCAGPDGPVATIRLENIRDGIEDYEYYVLLRRLLAERPPESLVGKTLGGMGRALRLGIGGEAGEVSEKVVRTLSDFSYDPAVLRAERRRVARAILRLRK